MAREKETLRHSVGRCSWEPLNLFFVYQTHNKGGGVVEQKAMIEASTSRGQKIRRRIKGQGRLQTVVRDCGKIPAFICICMNVCLI